MVASHVTPTGDLARNPGMCLDWESNLQPFSAQTSAQATEPHQPGLTLRGTEGTKCDLLHMLLELDLLLNWKDWGLEINVFSHQLGFHLSLLPT